MVSRSKLYVKLDALESELKGRLAPHLQQAANGMNDLIFCAEGYHSFPQLTYHTDKLTEELIGIGAQILSLRSKLNEPSEGSTAERICWYCNEWSDTSDHNRHSGQTLAKRFLDEIASKESV